MYSAYLAVVVAAAAAAAATAVAARSAVSLFHNTVDRQTPAVHAAEAVRFWKLCTPNLLQAVLLLPLVIPAGSVALLRSPADSQAVLLLPRLHQQMSTEHLGTEAVGSCTIKDQSQDQYSSQAVFSCPPCCCRKEHMGLW